MRPRPGRVAALLFCSGLSALIYQTAWQRSLRLIFGASTAASAAVLAVFLGGLGVGGVMLGRRAERTTRPLLLYGNLELGVAASALASPLLLSFAGRIYFALGGSEALGAPLATLVRLVLTAAAIGPAVLLMGGTLPAAARAVERDGDRARSTLAVLYGANTLGAVAGALLGTFALFEVFGTRMTVVLAALLNALVAVVARSLGRSAEDVPVDESPSSTRGSGAKPILAYAVAASAGFAFLLVELVWYRLLSPLLGGSAYTFGLVLATALAGIGLGGLAYAARGDDRPASALELALVTAVEGALIAVPIALGDRVALFAAMTRPTGSLEFLSLVTSWASVTALVVLPPAFVSGYQFPLLFALLGEGRARVARQVGAIYGFNTAGSIAGSLLGGFLLIPRLGAVGCLRGVAGFLLSVSVVVAISSLVAQRERALRALGPLLVVALGAVLVTRSGPSAVSRHEPIGAGRAHPDFRSRNALVAWMRHENDGIVWEADGVETTVALRKGDQLAFVVDGKTDGAVFSDRATQAASGLIAAVLHPSPRRAFVIGLGTGMTAGWLAAVPGMDRVDVAELEPSIVEVARAAAAANQQVLERPNVKLHFGDGRELLLTSHAEYDIVVSEPSNPYRAGISALYTHEFYDAVLSRLSTDGIFVQWVQGYEIDAETLRTAIRTLRSVFGDVEAWQTEYGDVVFLAARRARVLDVARMRSAVATEPFRSALVRTMLVGDVEGLLSHFIATDALLREVSELPGVAVNSDDENTLDYAFARTTGTIDDSLPLGLLSRAIRANQARPAVVGDVDWARVDELRPRVWLSGAAALPPLALPTRDAERRVKAVELACAGKPDEAFRAWQSQSAEPRDEMERFVVGMGLAELGDPRADGFADALAAEGLLTEAELVRAHLAIASGSPSRAMDAAERALAGLRKDPLPLCGAGREVLGFVGGIARSNPAFRARAVHELVGRPFAASALDEERRELGEELAFETNDVALALSALGSHVQRPVWDEVHLRRRLQILEAAGHPEAAQARADLQDFLRETSGSLDVP